MVVGEGFTCTCADVDGYSTIRFAMDTDGFPVPSAAQELVAECVSENTYEITIDSPNLPHPVRIPADQTVFCNTP